ncbi:hypothetical protein MUY14_43175 [Amycolatopsis sp. FBCC-B4732]|uniref:hypothetical protein n=1 Tax=Amycolatopsis sp. FBCC-B4732 TaxID=3079339 RepID=UPI001FF151C1|nr:hypothetical protein [Amycolatopsis sp. FBCC-B4732]UOX88414.1 hypothetical protein MUY14_43175 [Amycolatopsis sp. FBCC-B4732]
MPSTLDTATNDAKPETAETKVRRALEAAAPGATAAKLASAAGIGRSAATKVLSRLAAEGLVTRTAGKDQSVPVTWTLRDEQNDDTAEVATTEDAADQHVNVPAAEPDAQEPGPSPVPDPDVAACDPATPGVTPKKDRLPKGGLYDMVLGFLQAHPGEEFGPAKIGVELVRSSGAVNNALEKLVTNGLATKTCEAPKRFTIN